MMHHHAASLVEVADCSSIAAHEAALLVFTLVKCVLAYPLSAQCALVSIHMDCSTCCCCRLLRHCSGQAKAEARGHLVHHQLRHLADCVAGTGAKVLPWPSPLAPSHGPLPWPSPLALSPGPLPSPPPLYILPLRPNNDPLYIHINLSVSDVQLCVHHQVRCPDLLSL